MQLYPQQQQALDAICNFIEGDNEVFILKGYAGTGKTTMIKALLPKLRQMDKRFLLMAPTGRAAKVLSNKTGISASTIHRAIYSVNRLTSVRHDENGELIKMTNYFYNDVEETRKHDVVEFWFGLDQDRGEDYDPRKMVYIVDESSMVSSRESHGELFHFGSGVLLNDLLEYADLVKGAKIIFIGDPAQLPPVGDNRSAALTEEFFVDRNFKVSSFELTDVVRQGKDSAILENAMMVRDLLQASQRNTLSFKRVAGEVEDLSSMDMIAKYVELYPEPAFGYSAIISFSNSAAKAYNDSIRNCYYPGKQYVQVGDILQVVKNHYIALGTEALYNGDFVRVLDVSEQTEVQSAPVWTNSASGRIKKTVSLTFRDATIQTEDGDIYKMKIVDTLLNNSEPGLTVEENTALYINFRMRHPSLPKDNEALAKAVMADPYYNALNVKYGYAITGHKSQGGDWDTVFVDYSGRTGLNNDSLRWVYTATTRAKNRLYGANMPDIHPFDRFQIRGISKANKPSPNALSVLDMGQVELLTPTATNSQKAKCLSVVAALNRLGFAVERVEQMQYKDRYHINVGDKVEKYDCLYNGAGIYSVYQPLQQSANVASIIDALHSDECYEYRIDYTPSNAIFAQLYSKMQSAADELGVQLTNVVEETAQYYIVYHLKTSGQFSRIKFYFNANHFVTYAQPESDLSADDVLLQRLIEKLA